MTDTFVTSVNSLVRVTVQDADGSVQEILATDTHPFYVEGFGWVDAASLVGGERLIESDTAWATVLSVDVQYSGSDVDVYNFEVDGTHSYYVSSADGDLADAVWVHNGKVPCGPIKARKFDVGEYGDLISRTGRDGLDAHHVGQKAVMKRLDPGYNAMKGPAILVPRVGHTTSGPRGILSRSTKGFKSIKDLISRDIRELRRVYPDITEKKLRELIKLNKKNK